MNASTGLFVALSAFAIPPLVAQGTAKTLRPEGPGLVAPTYRSDSLATRIETAFGPLEVIAERGRSDPGIASGKYYVRLSGRRIAVGSDPSLTLGAPNLAAYYPGDPTILLFSTYTGGQGVPGYFIKIILLNRDTRGFTNAQVYSLGASEDLGSDRFVLANGPTDGGFTLSNGEYTLTYSSGTLRLESGGVVSAAPVPAPSAEAERAYVASMKSDLRNLVTAEEAYFADSVQYTTKVGSGGLAFQFSEGTRLLSLQVTSDGWTAKVGHARTKTICAIFVGSTPLAPATKEGAPACR